MGSTFQKYNNCQKYNIKFWSHPINESNSSYDLSPMQNSNSTVASVLHSVGIDVKENLPTNTSANDVPGIDNLLKVSTTLRGTTADDIIYGGAGNSRLYGNAGNDQLLGEGGNDHLNGGTGNDRTNGGSGRNRVTLGPGKDIHDLTRGAGYDTILDFRDSQDKLALPRDLSFGSISIRQRRSDTLIQQGTDVLAVLRDINSDAITISDFSL